MAGLVDWIERVREKQLLRMSSSIWFMQLVEDVFNSFRKENIGRRSISFWALEDDEFYFEHIKCTQWGNS